MAMVEVDEDDTVDNLLTISDLQSGMHMLVILHTINIYCIVIAFPAPENVLSFHNMRIEAYAHHISGEGGACCRRHINSRRSGTACF